jgi:plastocyanin
MPQYRGTDPMNYGTRALQSKATEAGRGDHRSGNGGNAKPRRWHVDCDWGMSDLTHTIPEGTLDVKTNRFTAAALLLLGLAMFAAACNNDSSNPYGSSAATAPSTPSAPAPNTVVMSGMAFVPATITVTVGTTVTWKNADGVAHTSTSDTGVWDTGRIGAGATATATFTTPGTYPYNCVYHASMGMKGTVIVQ